MTADQGDRWRELSRRECGLYLHDAHGQSGHFSYANLVYLVTEGRKSGEVRERIEQGEPLYLHQHGDLADIFHIAGISMARLQGECRSLDRKQKRRAS